MKGIVFTEFFEFVEETHSPTFLQETINEANLDSHGVYTATGTYPACEMGALVTTLAQRSGHEVSSLLKLFGQHLFGHFFRTSTHFFDGIDNAFDFLVTVEDKIHVDVKKLYPDAELPSFDIIEHTDKKFVMLYKSSRGLGDLCEGLIQGCLEHFGQKAAIGRRPIATEPVTIIEFTLDLKCA